MTYKKQGPPPVGLVYDDTGYIKAGYLCPPTYWYAAQLKAIIVADQPKFSNEVEKFCGVNFTKDNTVYFNADSILLGLLKGDPNKLSIFIDFRETRTQGGSDNIGKLTLDVYVCPGNTVDTIELASMYLTGLSSLFYGFNESKLIAGWPANISTATDRANYAPHIIRDTNKPVELNPDRIQGQIQKLGAIGAISAYFTLQFKPNRMTYPLS